MNSLPSHHDAIVAAKDFYLRGQFESAILAAQPFLGDRDDHAELLNLVGACHLNLGNMHEAERLLRRAADSAPRSADISNNLGVLYQSLGRVDDAEQWFRLAISITPNHYQALLNVGLLLRSRRHFKEAELAIRQAIEQTPDNHMAFNALGLVLKDLHRHSEAEVAYRHALALCPLNATYKLNLGVLLLSRNNWDEGLPLFESRHDPEMNGAFSSPPSVSFPRWRGESLENASLLIWPEQGHGDQIQLVRYIQKIRSLGARHITLICSAATHSLFNISCKADSIISRETFDPSTCPAHDYWTYIWSIPLNLREKPTSILADIPYLRAPRNAASKWESLIPKGRLRVGLIWKGNPKNANDAVRSLPSLKTLEPLWQIDGITYVSLQRETSGADLRSEIGDRFIVNLGSRTADFSDVAAIISRLDLVIGVDTAAMHLAAALGKPAWILLSSVATDWRWTYSGSTSEWYPGVVTLFRQEADEPDWSGVVDRVVNALSILRNG